MFEGILKVLSIFAGMPVKVLSNFTFAGMLEGILKILCTFDFELGYLKQFKKLFTLLVLNRNARNNFTGIVKIP